MNWHWLRRMGWLALALAAPCAQALQPCRVEGLPNALQCGVLQRALDPGKPQGVQIEVHYMVIPAMARNKQPDAVLLLAGGPGQSAIDVAPGVLAQLRRLNNRRDMVFIDQRGTGRSAPLMCADESRLPLQQSLDPVQQLRRLQQCSAQLAQLPYGDLRFFTTSLAVQDFEAVRVALGVPQWNLVGASYGTRVALEYLRQFPGAVRRTVLDGVAPPDMVLPLSSSTDAQAAFEGVLRACEQDVHGEAACAHHYPQLRQDWARLLAGLPRQTSVAHPVSGELQSVQITREALLHAVRTPLYAPALAAGLPAAVHAAAQGNFAALVGLSAALGQGKASRLAMGMHFSVLCTEDVPRLAMATAPAATDFGRTDADLYERVCQFWPRGSVPDGFYTIAPATSPVLLLSGGADPATPPHHGERVARALGARAQHIVVPEAGHGVMGLGCMRDVLLRFVSTATDAAALPQDAGCALAIPRPGVFLPLTQGAGAQVQP